MDRKKKSKQNERLLKQKIARRIKYSEIKADPVLYELEKEKEKEDIRTEKIKRKLKA